MSEAPEADAELLRRYAAGDALAYELLYRRHELRIWRYLERHVGERELAEELMQEVWFAVAREAPRYQPRAKFTTWLFTIAHHRVVDALRSRRGHESLEELDPEGEGWLAQLATEPGAGPLAEVMSRDQAQALRRAMSLLPLEQRDAFLLHIEGDLAVEDVAAVTGCPAETTKSRLRYARSKLRELLKEHA